MVWTDFRFYTHTYTGNVRWLSRITVPGTSIAGDATTFCAFLLSLIAAKIFHVDWPFLHRIDVQWFENHSLSLSLSLAGSHFPFINIPIVSKSLMSHNWDVWANLFLRSCDTQMSLSIESEREQNAFAWKTPKINLHRQRFSRIELHIEDVSASATQIRLIRACKLRVAQESVNCC